MARLRANFLTGKTTNNPLLIGGTTLNSPSLAAMEVVTSPDYMAVSLDPEGSNGPPEIIWITDHAAASSSATIERHKENTLAREHPADTDWVNALTAQDIDELYADVADVENQLTLYLPLAGGILTGLLTLSGPPTDVLHAATKAYVDGKVAGVTVAWTAVTGKPSTFPPASHDHPAGDIVSGQIPAARINTGTTSSEVAIGNHGHSGLAPNTALLAHQGTGSQIIVSSSGPSGGQNGDIWLKV